jgi:2-phospho-L-lactate transferase/gluconeogenesis factor (CofD/UPF0052 family)
MVRVVLFTGGRGSAALSERLATDPDVDLTLVVNGYDDGASTGRVRAFLGDCLGPSDFRKNASRLARLKATCEPAAIALLDHRLPDACGVEDAAAAIRAVDSSGPSPPQGAAAGVAAIADGVTAARRAACSTRLGRFFNEVSVTGWPFDFSDCAIGNLVFAGAFLLCGRRFNDAVADYAAVLGLPPGLLANVSDGTNAFLVGLTEGGGLLATEEAIVDAQRRNRVLEVFLLAERLTAPEEREFRELDLGPRARFLAQRSVVIPCNPALDGVLSRADLIVYAPGTQHSSLFPSYLTRGLAAALSANLTATKLLVTNIEPDAEITGRTAVDIVNRAVFYLEEKGRLTVPAPALITHCLINDPREGDRQRVPTGRLEAVEDPRVVRVAYYEDGVSGRHDAAKVLGPFLDAFVRRQRPAHVAVVLHGTVSPTKVCQTVLEFVRVGLHALPIELLVLHGGPEPLEPALAARIPFGVAHIPDDAVSWDDEVLRRLDAWGADHIVLFDSSGMYRGEDVRVLVGALVFGRSDVVWGSRRLSSRDIDESYRLRYRHNVVRGALSFVGSYVLSLAYLFLYGRYISDTLSGGRAMRYALFRQAGARLSDPNLNHRLLAPALRAGVLLHEVPVRFLPMSPERARRVTIREGFAALAIAIALRFTRNSLQRTTRVGSVL